MRDEMGMPLSLQPGTREAKFENAPELKVKGDWLCLNVERSCAWPVRPQSLEFDGHQLWIVPLTEEDYPGVAISRPAGLDRDEAEGLLLRFLSVLAWREECGIAVAHRSGGGLPFMMGRANNQGFATRDEFDFTEIVCPVEEEARIALALVREARSLNHHGYSFLSFWRVLELAYPKTNARVAWMVATLPTLKGAGVQEALNSVGAATAADLSKHLFKSSRCAIAHATGKPIVNPDDPRDARRLYRELPLVRELAIRAVEDRFGIPTRATEYQQHLYELRGWKDIFGPDLIARAIAGEKPADGENVNIPNISVRLRQSPSYAPLENMTVASANLQDRLIYLAFQSPNGLTEIRFALDFTEERLLFDLQNGIFGHDDKSVEAAEHRYEISRFVRDYLLNGELQIWDTDTGSLLSRKDAFLPVNCMVDLDGCNSTMASLREEIDRRRAALTA